MLIKVEAIVREEMFEDVKDALNQIEVNGITVSQVMGCGVQRGYKEVVRGSEVDIVLQPKVKFEIVVSSEEWEKKVIDANQLPRCKHSSTVLGSYVTAHSTCLSLLLPQD